MKLIKLIEAIAFGAILFGVQGATGAATGQADNSQSQSGPAVWRHFGDSTSPQAPSSPGWRHFGSASAPVSDSKASAVPTKTPQMPTGEVRSATPGRSGGTRELEYRMYELINRDRLDPANAAETGGHAQALQWNAKLAAAAREHSRDMLQQKFFAHVDREGRSPGTRVKAAGIPWQSVGENIAIYDKIPAAEEAFMHEPRFGHNHRSNILGSKYTDVGVGIVQGPDGRYYITQEFIETPRSLRASF